MFGMDRKHMKQVQVEFSNFSDPYMAQETWRIGGKSQTVTPLMEWFPHFRAVPISCPIGHHIGFMVTNDVPILPDTEHEMTLYRGYLKIRVQRSMKNPGRWSSGFPVFLYGNRRDRRPLRTGPVDRDPQHPDHPPKAPWSLTRV